MNTQQHIKTVSEKKNIILKAMGVLSILILSTQISTAQDLVASAGTKNYEVLSKDTITEAIESSNVKVASIVNDYFKGTQDAGDGYKAKKSGRRAIFFASLLGTPVLAVIPAIITSSTCPRVRNLHVANDTLLHNTAYMRGYKDEAHDIKKRAIWGYYLAGSVLWVGVVNLLIF